MDTILLRIVQAGLNEKYRKDELDKFSVHKGGAGSNNVKALGITELGAPIILLLALQGLSILVFILGIGQNFCLTPDTYVYDNLFRNHNPQNQRKNQKDDGTSQPLQARKIS